MRIDALTGSFIGAGEDSIFKILREMTNLPERYHNEFPQVGIYRQLPITYVLDNEQLYYLADFHKKSSIDIFMIPFDDEYMPHLTRIAIRVEGKKGSMKMNRQGVQKNLLTKWCQVIDFHHYECPNLFKDRVDEKSIEEFKNAFKTAKFNVMDLII